MKEKLTADLKYYFIDMTIVSLFGYIFYVIMGKYLAPVDYGIMMTVLGVYAIILPLASLGFNETTARFISIDEKRAKSYLDYALKITVALSLMISAVILLFPEQIAAHAYANSAMTQPLMMLALLVFSGSISIVLKGTLQGLKRFFSMLIFDVISQVFRLVIPLILLLYGFGILGGLLGWVLAFLAFDILAMGYLMKKLHGYKKFKIEKEFLKFAISSAVFASAMWLLIQNSLLILGLFNMEEAGLFGAALVFGQILLSFPLIVIGVILPHLSHLFSIKSIDSARRLSEISLKNTFILMFPASMFIAFFSRQILYHIYSPSYLEASKYFWVTMPAFLFLGLNMILVIMLYSYGKHISRIKYTVGSVLLSILFSVSLYNIFGAIGVAYGFLISQILTLIYVSFACKRKMQISFPKKIFNSIPAASVFLALIYLIDKYYFGFEYALLFILIATAAYFLLLYIFRTFNKDDYDLIKLFLKRK